MSKGKRLADEQIKAVLALTKTYKDKEVAKMIGISDYSVSRIRQLGSLEAYNAYRAKNSASAYRSNNQQAVLPLDEEPKLSEKESELFQILADILNCHITAEKLK